MNVQSPYWPINDVGSTCEKYRYPGEDAAREAAYQEYLRQLAEKNKAKEKP